MIVYDSRKREIARTETTVRGVPFLFGEQEISIRGYSISALPYELLRAHREGDTYLVEDAGEYWKLWLVAFRGVSGLMVAPEPHIINKEGAIVSLAHEE